MSKYHPLDVRHPSNRNRERNRYLLDPPNANSYALRKLVTREQAPSRRRADLRDRPAEGAAQTSATTVVTEAPVTVAASSGTPWGASAAGATSGQNAPRARRPLRLTRLIVFGVIGYAILNAFGLWGEIAGAFEDIVRGLGI